MTNLRCFGGAVDFDVEGVELREERGVVVATSYVRNIALLPDGLRFVCTATGGDTANFKISVLEHGLALK